MRILWPLINALQALFAMGWSALWIPIALLASLLARNRRVGLAFARRVWSPGILWAAITRLEVEGNERFAGGGPCFFVANHQSWLDVPALFVALRRPVLFVAKRELARIPFLGGYIGAMGMVFIDRSHRQDSARSVGQATERLRQGWSVVSFPEGTRSRDGQVHSFKTATFAAAIEAGVPVVPVVIEGTGRALPPEGWHPRPGLIRVVFGEPIPTAGLARSERTALAKRAEEAVRALLAGEGGSP
ncbi:MAG TPA: lysophospholipid acyltransferase family protein [Thermoanaerobaculia bacterium]|nr:lysophospholipid acyltransferase family protein [Thermoanaerobaculia bacterium]